MIGLMDKDRPFQTGREYSFQHEGVLPGYMGIIPGMEEEGCWLCDKGCLPPDDPFELGIACMDIRDSSAQGKEILGE
jgi:hypothetical protein